MPLLDRFRRRLPWEHPDAAVRAEAVREIPAADQALIEQVARTDPDPRVRKAALRRLHATAVLALLAAGDADESVREAAREALLEAAMGEDEGAAATALGALGDARSLLALARSARLPAIRRGALARIQEDRPLATLAKTAEDPATRMEALQRVTDPALLVEIASKGEHKDAAVAAVERIEEPAALESIAAGGRNRAAARRARARLETTRPGAAPAAPPTGGAAPAPEPPSIAEPSPELEPVAAAVEVAAPEVPADAAAPATPAVPAAIAPRESPIVGTDAGEAAGPEPSSVGPGPGGASGPEPGPAAQDSGEVPSEEAATGGATQVEPVRDGRPIAARALDLCQRLEALLATETLGRREAEAGLRQARALRDELGHVPARLRQRLKAARGRLFARTQELREADEWRRWGNATAQEELCQRMESLVAREDFEQVAREVHEADTRWAQFREAPRQEGEALRHRYQAARSRVKERLDDYFRRKTALEAENLKQKEALCQRAEALADSTDWLRASQELKGLQAQWKRIGPAPRKAGDAVWKRFRAACDRFFTRRQDDLRQRKQHWAENLARKEALCAKAEALAGSTDWESAAAQVRTLQAEWKTIGPVRRSRSEQVWQRFRAACDTFFERYKRKDALVQEARRAEREALCAELEALLPAGREPAPPPPDLAAAVQSIQARFRQMPASSATDDAGLARRFAEARERLIEAFPASFRGTDLDPEASRARKEKLCARVEALLAAAEKEAAPLSAGDLAQRLKEALATRTMGGQVDTDARHRLEIEELRAAQSAWKRLGPVPGTAGAALEERFEKACARFLEHRRGKRASGA